MLLLYYYVSSNGCVSIWLLMFQCARNGYVDVAEILLSEKTGNDIDGEDEEGLTPLHYAARYNHFKIVQLLVQNGASKYQNALK